MSNTQTNVSSALPLSKTSTTDPKSIDKFVDNSIQHGVRGTVTSFSSFLKYGYIRRHDTGEEIRVDITGIVQHSHRCHMLKAGQEVEFTAVYYILKEAKAIHVTLPGGQLVKNKRSGLPKESIARINKVVAETSRRIENESKRNKDLNGKAGPTGRKKPVRRSAVIAAGRIKKALAEPESESEPEVVEQKKKTRGAAKNSRKNAKSAVKKGTESARDKIKKKLAILEQKIAECKKQYQSGDESSQETVVKKTVEKTTKTVIKKTTRNVVKPKPKVVKKTTKSVVKPKPKVVKNTTKSVAKKTVKPKVVNKTATKKPALRTSARLAARKDNHS